MNSKQTIIFFAGGQTAGPVSPLLAVARKLCLESENYRPHFIDVPNAAVNKLITPDEFPVHTILSGKLRRYWSLYNLFAPLILVVGFIHSLLLLKKFKPRVVVGAGGYAQVPVIWAAWLLEIPAIIHQQDLEPTLSNKLCALPAKKITTAFEKSIKDFSEGVNFFRTTAETKQTKMFWVGSPTNIHETEIDKNQALKSFDLNTKLPVVLVVGGGSGALGLNKILTEALPELSKIAQILHSTGTGKQTIAQAVPNYKPLEFITNMTEAYYAADLVITRAGIGAITELSALGKVSIVVPMPHTHQETNAQLLYEKQAAIVLDETTLTTQQLVKTVRDLFFNLDKQKHLSENIRTIFPKNSTSEMVKIIKEVING